MNGLRECDVTHYQREVEGDMVRERGRWSGTVGEGVRGEQRTVRVRVTGGEKGESAGSGGDGARRVWQGTVARRPGAQRAGGRGTAAC